MNKTMNVTTCRICGGLIEGGSKKTGRPGAYCSIACRRTSQYELRRIQARLIRLEDEAEACRRNHSGLLYFDGSTNAQHAADITREIEHAKERLRELLSADP